MITLITNKAQLEVRGTRGLIHVVLQALHPSTIRPHVRHISNTASHMKTDSSLAISILEVCKRFRL